jgi:glycosyltransferase involved in cell wall biosynthesis
LQPKITIALPSFNQGSYLAEALSSVLSQNIATEVFLMDGGSTDNSVEVIDAFRSRLSGWRSAPDAGQAAAINEGIALGSAEYVAWVNSDDWLLPGALDTLAQALALNPSAPFAYGRAWNYVQSTKTQKPVWVEPFSVDRLAQRCVICQPATLIRRSCWEACHGLDAGLHMAMDYDLWWRLYKNFGEPVFVDQFVATNRDHELTKTRTKRKLHYSEAMRVVRKYNGTVPIKWWLMQPYSVWFKSFFW